MKTKKIFAILFGIWLVDFILTFVALNFLGFYELNSIARFFYDKGLYGFGLFFVINFFGIMMFSFLFHKASYNKYNSKPQLTLFVGFLSFFLIQASILINNVYWLI